MLVSSNGQMERVPACGLADSDTVGSSCYDGAIRLFGSLKLP
jgi:hypothetical protein